jgi:hypothetical protein
LKQHADLIVAAGLPQVVLSDEDHWWDFWDHAFLDHHPDPTKFTVDQLSVRQKAALLRLLLNWKADGATTVLGEHLVHDLLEVVEQAYKY